jgi:polyhydroxyalkanoate synthesis regulator protein
MAGVEVCRYQAWKNEDIMKRLLLAIISAEENKEGILGMVLLN